ncbi:MAG TPA: flavin reductase family protein [Candidatus Thermoplasmatota archaeon]|nr:flavin reductase family protein [Candidatus Thermoplasmatota archaeon]
MEKKKLGSKPMIYPMPVTLVGADVEGKPNFMTIAFINIINMNPAMVAMGASPSHHTCKGIRENKTFSINLPSKDMLEVTDYVGLTSGAKKNKAGLFSIFRGITKTAPMIEECPLNLECKLLQRLSLGGTDDLYIGEVVETYCEPKFLTNGKPDIKKMGTFVFSMNDNRYFSLGQLIGNAWSTGKTFITK